MVAGAFQDFLQTFKSSGSSEATSALEDLRLGGDGSSDEYDFMDDANGEEDSRRRARRREPKRKYIELLQDVADRKRDHLYIDLDDLDEVRHRFNAT